MIANNTTFTDADEATSPRGERPRIGPSLLHVATRSRPLPDRVVIYADAKWGKTSLAAMLPDPIFLTTRGEDGLQKLIEGGRLPETAHFEHVAASWNDVNLAVNELIVNDHPYKTFILDTANGAERLAQEQIADDKFNGDMACDKFAEFGRGETAAAKTLWLPFLQLLDRLREARRMRIVLCCHTAIRNFKNPEGPDYDRIEPALSKQAWGFTSKWCDMILYGTFTVEASKESKIAKAKAKGGKVRVLHTERTATFDAGNRHGLRPVIQLGDTPQSAYKAFLAAFPARAPKPHPQPEEKTQNGNGQQGNPNRPPDPRSGNQDVQ